LFIFSLVLCLISQLAESLCVSYALFVIYINVAVFQYVQPSCIVISAKQDEQLSKKLHEYSMLYTIIVVLGYATA